MGISKHIGKTKTVALVILLVIVTYSCRKSTTVQSNNNNQPTYLSGNYGYLIATRIFAMDTMNNSLYFQGNTGNAFFLNEPNRHPSVSVGSVFIGSTKFKHQNSSGNHTYEDSTNMLSISPTAWHINGAGIIPTFTFTNNDSLPIFTGYASLPDTIDRFKNLNVFIPINGVNGADFFMVEITDGIDSMRGHVYAGSGNDTVKFNNTTSFPESSLSVLTPANSFKGTLTVSLQKNNYQTISGRTFKFTAELRINKKVYIK